MAFDQLLNSAKLSPCHREVLKGLLLLILLIVLEWSERLPSLYLQFGTLSIHVTAWSLRKMSRRSSLRVHIACAERS